MPIVYPNVIKKAVERRSTPDSQHFKFLSFISYARPFLNVNILPITEDASTPFKSLLANTAG